jgi:hypothetical protein
MALSEAQKNAMRYELRIGADIVSVARSFGCSLHEVRDVKYSLDLPAKEIQPDWGIERLQKYAIARTRVGIPWDNRDPAIQKARIEYDLGMVEIMTGRAETADGPYFILYSVERVVCDTKRTPYFSRNFNDN